MYVVIVPYISAGTRIRQEKKSSAFELIYNGLSAVFSNYYIKSRDYEHVVTQVASAINMSATTINGVGFVHAKAQRELCIFNKRFKSGAWLFRGISAAKLNEHAYIVSGKCLKAHECNEAPHTKIIL